MDLNKLSFDDSDQSIESFGRKPLENQLSIFGMKGTMSEAELHVLRARLRGGIVNKARRGELWITPPVKDR